MSVFAKAEAAAKLAQIQGNMTAAVQAAANLESACNRVNALWQDWKTANADDQATLDAAQAEFAALSGAAWTEAKASIMSAMDILAGGWETLSLTLSGGATLAYMNRTAQDASDNGVYVRWVGVTY